MEKAIELGKVATLAVCNDCNELIDFVINKLDNYPLDFLEFQGDTLEVTKTDLSYEEFGIIKEDTLVSISSSAEGFFDLHAVKSPMNFNDNFPCVVVPDCEMVLVVDIPVYAGENLDIAFICRERSK